MPGKITLEQKMHAVKIAKSGKSPLPYLKQCGARNPSTSWETIRNNYLKTHEGEDLPARFGQPKKAEGNMTVYATKEKPADMPTVKLTGPIRIETPEGNQVEVIEQPALKLKPGLRGLNNSDFEVSAIKHPSLGEFYYDEKFGVMDWRTPEGEEVSMSPKAWKKLYELIPDVIGILRVPDDE